MKNILEEVLEDSLVSSMLESFSDDEKKEIIKEDIETMLKDINDLYIALMDLVATESGINQMSETIEYLISDEGIKEWQEKN